MLPKERKRRRSKTSAPIEQISMDPLIDAAAMSVTGGPDVTPREWPVCASYR